MPFVLPGERVSAEVLDRKPGLVRARPQQIATPSPERVLAPCPYFTRCGGCHYQHAPYEAQLRFKTAILEETLRRVGKIEPPSGIAAISGEPWNYRNRSQFRLTERQIGYLEAGSHELCAIEYCPISSPKINETITALRRMMREPRWPRFVRGLEVFTNETDVQINVTASERPVARHFFEWCAAEIPGFVPGPLDYPAAGAVFRVGGRSFFQVNRFLIDALVDAALAGESGESALDLYAGAGLFSIPLARAFRRVTAVEQGAAAEDLIHNARGKVEAVRSPVENFLETLSAAPDFVVLDPPRAGLGKGVVRRLIELKPARMAIVACDPATLARDLNPLLASGYRLDRLALIDLFPQTYHMETVARLSRQ